MAALLVDCEPLLEPINVVAQKWVIISKTQKELRPVQDKRALLTYSYARVREKIAELSSFAIAKDAFKRDTVFSDGARTAGYWATFEAVLQYLIGSAGQIHKRSVSLDHAEVLRYLRSFRQLLTSRHLQYEASVRLFGVDLRYKSLPLPDGVALYRLNREERNERQPVSQPYLLDGWGDQVLGDHPAELRVSITVPVDQSQDGAFFKAQNDAYQFANEIFYRILQAVLVASSGRARLSSISLKGGVEQLPIGRSISREMPPHANIMLGKKELSNICTAYDLVSGGQKSDKTLSRALHRFILGRQRGDLIDKLVDFVIAWEAILLTQDGNPITQELSYRFALNGASIISAAKKNTNPKEIYKKMRSAYSTRSSIVHGGEDKDRDKALQTGDFRNLQELCDFLESNFRQVVFWLALTKPASRPYRQTGGWESLIWSTK